MSTHRSGAVIVIEGIDGSGKSTLIKNLVKKLEDASYEIVQTREPGGSWLGKHIRPLLQHQPQPLAPKAEYLLFAADRAQHLQDVINPAVKQKKIVLSDRMGDSSVVYQGYGRGLDPTFIQQVNEWALDGLRPDATLYVAIDVDTALERIHTTRDTLTAFEQERAFLARWLRG